MSVVEQVRKSVDYIFEHYCSADVYIVRYQNNPNDDRIYDIRPAKKYGDPIQIRGYIDIDNNRMEISNSDGPRVPVDGSVLLAVEDLKKVGLWNFDTQNTLISTQDRILYLNSYYEIVKCDPIGVIQDDPILVEVDLVKLVDR